MKYMLIWLIRLYVQKISLPRMKDLLFEEPSSALSLAFKCLNDSLSLLCIKKCIYLNQYLASIRNGFPKIQATPVITN